MIKTIGAGVVVDACPIMNEKEKLRQSVVSYIVKEYRKSVGDAEATVRHWWPTIIMLHEQSVKQIVEEIMCLPVLEEGSLK